MGLTVFSTKTRTTQEFDEVETGLYVSENQDEYLVFGDMKDDEEHTDIED